MSQHPIPVFVLGSGRSGTTITASLLNHLPGVQIAKETGYIGQNLALLQDIEHPDALARLVQEVNSWLEKERWEHSASIQGFRDFCQRYQFFGGAAFIHYIWQLDSTVPWHELSFIGDNTPLYVMAIPAIQVLLPNAQFIHMVRDPRDVVSSVLKMRFGADDVVVAAMEWHLTLGCWLMAERIVSADRRMECRYEDLCTAPSKRWPASRNFSTALKRTQSPRRTAHSGRIKTSHWI
ncbi:MAG: sulfotransferase [Planctomycetaceae bacterium]